MSNVKTIQNLRVVAIAGKGLYIADEADNAWHVAGDASLQEHGGKLSEIYYEAVE